MRTEEKAIPKNLIDDSPARCQSMTHTVDAVLGQTDRASAED